MHKIISLGNLENNYPHLPFSNAYSAAGTVVVAGSNGVQTHQAAERWSGMGVGRGSSEQRFQGNCKYNWQNHKQRQALQIVAIAPSSQFLFKVMITAGCTSANSRCPGKPNVTLVTLAFLWASKYSGVPQSWAWADIIEAQLWSQILPSLWTPLNFICISVIALCSVLLYSSW